MRHISPGSTAALSSTAEPAIHDSLLAACLFTCLRASYSATHNKLQGTTRPMQLYIEHCEYITPYVPWTDSTAAQQDSQTFTKQD
jgi:hypothetical protein